MVQWNPLFKALYNVQQSTINSRWKQVATALTLFDSRKRWRLDVACAMHTGPSWVLKGRLNESHYTFCKPAFFSSLLSCATTSNNQDKGHLPLWTPFSHSGTLSWIVYRYRSHGSCCTKHKGWLQTSFPFLHQRCCSPLPWHQLLRCRLQGFSFCWNLSAFSLCFFADVFSLWSYCYHWFAGNSWFSLKETVEYGEWRIPRFNVSGTRQCSFTVTLVFIPINPAVYFTTSMLNIMRELASHPLTSWYTIKIIFWTEFKCNYKIFSCTQHFHVPGSHAWLLLYYITNFLPLFC